jgi:hypothetical protein
MERRSGILTVPEHCGKIKGRGCADRRKQREWIDPDDTWSPTVPNEAVFLTAMIDATKEGDVAIVDIRGAFMQADIDDVVHVRFFGNTAEMFLEIDRKMCSPYKRGEMVLYVGLLKALYGTLRAVRLFWRNYHVQCWEELTAGRRSDGGKDDPTTRGSLSLFVSLSLSLFLFSSVLVFRLCQDSLLDKPIQQ